MSQPKVTHPTKPHSFTPLQQDVEAIGQRCQYEYCNQYDFLPFRCESCRHTFCASHRTETGHQCANKGAWAAKRVGNNANLSANSIESRPTVANATQCAEVSCKTLIHTLTSVGVHCQKCNRQYCLKHRLGEDHSCATLIPIGARVSQAQSQGEKARNALNRLKLWSKEKQAAMLPSSKSKTSSAATSILALNKLKQTAKGDVKVPVEKRIYLHVEAEASTTSSKIPHGELFYSGEWTIGRLLDAASKSLQVQNANNRADSEQDRLRVFHVERGRLLEFSEKVQQTCSNGETLVLLRGVGAS